MFALSDKANSYFSENQET